MIIVVYPEDLRSDYKGKKQTPTIEDFPALKRLAISTSDAVVYRYRNIEKILKHAEEKWIPKEK